jgi:hypothetical protein
MGISGPEQTAITTGLRRRSYGDLTDSGSRLGSGSGTAAAGGPGEPPA